jgi:hypothetical protein
LQKSRLIAIRGIMLRFFSISHLSANGIPNFALLDTLSVLNVLDNISNLELKHVNLPLQPEEEIPDGWDFRVSLDDLLLKGLKRKLFKDFIPSLVVCTPRLNRFEPASSRQVALAILSRF